MAPPAIESVPPTVKLVAVENVLEPAVRKLVPEVLVSVTLPVMETLLAPERISIPLAETLPLTVIVPVVVLACLE